jgi:hypothetical protein
MVKNALAVVAAAVLGSLLATSAFAQGAKDVCDWRDLNAVHVHVNEAINELGRARAANHFDMAGHGAQAEALLKQAKDQLARAVEAAKANGNGHCHH